MLIGIQHYPRTFLDMQEMSCLLFLAVGRQDSSNVIWNPAISKKILGYARNDLPAYTCLKQAGFLKC